jgi:succinate-semialdehyde dehydrogenase/glutarate-semialdehyde dehydrogenase
VTAQPVARSRVEVRLLVNGAWVAGAQERWLPIVDPSTGEPVGRVAVASDTDIEHAVGAAEQGFEAWRAVAPFERARTLRQAAALLRERADPIASLLTTEQGKPLSQARHEILGSADAIDWFAEEGKRCFGQVIPGRTGSTHVLTRPRAP